MRVTDLVEPVDRRAQYATAGIPLYLVVVLDEKFGIWEIHQCWNSPSGWPFR